MIRFPDKETAKARLRYALEQGLLQCQQEGFDRDPDSCLYSGPCAVGVMLEPEDRQVLDDYAYPDALSIKTAIQDENLVQAPDWITADELETLQGHHDAGRIHLIRAFLEKV